MKRKLISALLLIAMLVVYIPFGSINAFAATFTQQNILQVNANTSSSYISGSWWNLTNGSSNIRTAGCGIVALVSSIYNLGDKIDKSDIGTVIDEVFDWAYSKGYWTSSAGTYWSMFTKADDKFGDKYGFSVSKQYGSKDSESTSLSSLVSHLKSNSGTAVVHVYGHFMAVVGYKNENGKEYLHVFDPAPGAGTNYNSNNRRDVTHAAGDWFELSVLKRDGGTKGGKGSTENIEIDGYWLITSTNNQIVQTGGTNPDNYPVCERDLVYNSTIETGNDVKWVQSVLKHLGYSIDVDGSYGPTSRDVIKKFQKDYGLTVDGMTGPNTRSKLKEVWKSKGHSYSITSSQQATCTTGGVNNYKCAYCEATKTESVSATGHSYGSWCNHSSSQHKQTCTKCDNAQYGNHSWNSGVVTTQPTCTANGVKTYTCTVCNATKTESIGATGHSYGSWCNHSSSQHKQTCTKCGNAQYGNHTWNSGVVTTQPTCTANGVKTYTCTICNATKTESVGATGHSYGSWGNHSSSQHKQTCTKCGNAQYGNHTWNSGVVTTQPTCTANGVKT